MIELLGYLNFSFIFSTIELTDKDLLAFMNDGLKSLSTLVIFIYLFFVSPDGGRGIW